MIGVIPLISRAGHGVIDYIWGPGLFLAPQIFGYADEKKAAMLSKLLGGGALVVSFCTQYELGAVKVVPFKTHLALGWPVVILALSGPWVFGFAGNQKARNALLVFGILKLGVMLMTRRPEED